MSMKLPPELLGVMLVSVVLLESAVSCTPFMARSAALTICFPDLSNHALTRWPEVTEVGLVEL